MQNMAAVYHISNLHLNTFKVGALQPPHPHLHQNFDTVSHISPLSQNCQRSPNVK